MGWYGLVARHRTLEQNTVGEISITENSVIKMKNTVFLRNLHYMLIKLYNLQFNNFHFTINNLRKRD
jgi:hypothetical protein